MINLFISVHFVSFVVRSVLRVLLSGVTKNTKFVTKNTTNVLLLLIIVACGCKVQNQKPVQGSTVLSDSSLLDLIQQQTIKYFTEGAEPVSGMAAERIHTDNDYPENDKHVITSGGSGFGVMCLIVAMERKFITREDGLQRLEKIVHFLETADRFHGTWPHWWNGETGKVKPFSKKDNGGDLVETSFMIQGLLCVRQYFL